MTRTECVIACCMIAVANLSLCLFLGAHPAIAQTATPDAAPAVTAGGQLPMMPESEMTWVNKVCKAIFYPVLYPFFKLVNDLLLKIPNWMAGFCGVGLFVCAMFWVAVILNKDYVNHGRPYKTIFTDLRLWTVISMTPHVLVYFYFR